MAVYFKQLVKFASVGLIGTIINLSVILIMTELFKVYYLISSASAFFSVMLTTFFINKFWTFKDSILTKRILLEQSTKFFISGTVSMMAALAVLYLLVEFAGFWYFIAQIVSLNVSMFINFNINRVWTFRNNS